MELTHCHARLPSPRFSKPHNGSQDCSGLQHIHEPRESPLSLCPFLHSTPFPSLEHGTTGNYDHTLTARSFAEISTTIKATLRTSHSSLSTTEDCWSSDKRSPWFPWRLPDPQPHARKVCSCRAYGLERAASTIHATTQPTSPTALDLVASDTRPRFGTTEACSSPTGP